MKLRSKGLGRKELVMDFREYVISREGDEIVVSGTIREPVTWDFTIRISQDDIPGMLRVGLSRHTLRMGARWVLRRKPRHDGPAPEEGDDSPGEVAPERPPRQRVRRTVGDLPESSAGITPLAAEGG